jgi:hypothetical protein
MGQETSESRNWLFQFVREAIRATNLANALETGHLIAKRSVTARDINICD